MAGCSGGGSAVTFEGAHTRWSDDAATVDSFDAAYQGRSADAAELEIVLRFEGDQPDARNIGALLADVSIDGQDIASTDFSRVGVGGSTEVEPRDGGFDIVYAFGRLTSPDDVADARRILGESGIDENVIDTRVVSDRPPEGTLDYVVDLTMSVGEIDVETSVSFAVTESAPAASTDAGCVTFDDSIDAVWRVPSGETVTVPIADGVTVVLQDDTRCGGVFATFDDGDGGPFIVVRERLDRSVEDFVEAQIAAAGVGNDFEITTETTEVDGRPAWKIVVDGFADGYVIDLGVDTVIIASGQFDNEDDASRAAELEGFIESMSID